MVLEEQAASAAHARAADAWWLYATEVLDHLRLPYRKLAAVDATTELDGVGVLVFARAPELTEPARTRVEEFVAAGGAVVVAGGPGSLGDLLGAAAGEPVDHGHVTFTQAAAWTHVPGVALHAVGGARLTTSDDATDVLATWDDGSPAITARRSGDGIALLFGADVWQSIVRIQQGYSVTEDGKPALDGTAPIDDDILKCEDGMALSFEADRALPPGEPELTEPFEHVYPPPSAVPMFDQPHADWWRSLFVQGLWWAAEQVGVALPWLHYWPSGVDAVAHMSHDSDGNVTEHGQAALDTFAEAEVNVTWCQVFPGGYDPEIYRAITAAGHEHALHYNAMHDADIAQWGWPQIRAQYAWAQAVTGVERIVSNKNHYTRWENWTEFYHWCERLGIEIDESRGPSKQGSVGFTFGTAHVSFPIAEASEHNRYLNVLNLPLHTQDLAWAGHESIRDVILDGAIAQHGVAHFLFHGPHLHLRPPTRKACLALADEARRRGLPWWTAGQINSWERLRRGVSLSIVPGADGWVVRTTSDRAVEGAALLLSLPALTALPRLVDGNGSVATVVRHGREFVELTADIPAGDAAWTLAR
ncbi:hypothetical protein GCM10027569_55070 [Flindersiella endophytica]